MRGILFITLSNIGDAVLSTPVLERLHQCYPQAMVDIVADPRSGFLFEHCPYRGEIFLKVKPEGWRGVVALLHTLRRKRYDLIVDLRTDGLAWLLRGKKRLTKWTAGQPQGPHAVHRHMSVIAPLTGPDIPAARVWLTGRHRAFADEQLKALPGKRWLALCPGANWPPKIWPAQCYQELVWRVKEYFDAVILLGGAKDIERNRLIAGNLPLPYLDLSGKTDLLQAAAIIERARAFTGNDSGMGHVAGAMATATLTLFGQGPPLEYHPWGPHPAWVYRPDGDTQKISVDEAAQTFRALLDGLP
ncbi:MAG: glycosyltransferase family 9 protein [Gammaproteobacteria bacterium]|nr:MAG: glycosyltransferase family 9 protein [Gammaproteobacteria bacterium]